MADKKKWPQAARDRHYGKSGGGNPGKKNLGRVIDETDPNLGYRDRRPGSVPDMLKVKARQNFTFGGGYSATFSYSVRSQGDKRRPCCKLILFETLWLVIPLFRFMVRLGPTLYP